MRRLNSINDPLARTVLALHRDCGSGSDACDGGFDGQPIAQRVDWGCETTGVIALHFGIEYPVAPPEIDWAASIRRLRPSFHGVANVAHVGTLLATDDQ